MLSPIIIYYKVRDRCFNFVRISIPHDAMYGIFIIHLHLPCTNSKHIYVDIPYINICQFIGKYSIHRKSSIHSRQRNEKTKKTNAPPKANTTHNDFSRSRRVSPGSISYNSVMAACAKVAGCSGFGLLGKFRSVAGCISAPVFAGWFRERVRSSRWKFEIGILKKIHKGRIVLFRTRGFEGWTNSFERKGVQLYNSAIIGFLFFTPQDNYLFVRPLMAGKKTNCCPTF